MKKFLTTLTAILLSLLLCIGLVACGETGNSNGEGNGSGVTDNTDDDDHLDDGRAIYTITFDSQGGSAIPSQTAVEGTSARNPDSPKREGYNFLGWYTEAEGGVEWKWNDPVNGNITVYAHWEADTVSDATASLEFEYDTALGGYVVTGVGQESALRIPAEYNGTRGTHPVVGIGDRAFYNKRIASVEFPASLVSIGGQAFTRTDLVTVTIPASVTTLGNYAFSECKSLTSVTFEAGSQLRSIGQRAFANDPALTELTIPASVTSIGANLIRSSGVATIHFLGTRSAWDAIEKADNWNYGNTDVEIICSDGPNVPETTEPTEPTEPTNPEPTDPEPTDPTGPDPTDPTEPTDPTDPTDPDPNPNPEPQPEPTASLQFKRSGDGYVVTGENQNTSVIVIPAEYADLPVVGIDERAFAYSNHPSPITSVTIPDSVTEIGQNAFNNQSALEEVHIGESSHLEKIGSNAFYGCSALKSFYLPAGCTSLGYDVNRPNYTVEDADYIASYGAVFNNCGALESFTVAAGNTSFAGMGGHLVYIGGAHNTSGAVILVRGVNAPVIPSGVTEIGEAAFREAKLTELYIPASVTKIGKYFIQNSAIKTVYYEGSAEAWSGIDKGRNWNMGAEFTVTYNTAPTAETTDELA